VITAAYVAMALYLAEMECSGAVHKIRP